MGRKIKEIIINSFRGYKDETIFNFTKDDLPADLIVLHAPNGFGKTSFFEAVEWCLSGDLSRITKNKILKDSEEQDRGYTLSNKYSDNLGEVTIVDIDSKKLKRQVSESRNSSKGRRDYGYDKIIIDDLKVLTKLDKTSHILTQDGMDSFLRFTTAKEKFDALSSFWNKGEEISERYRLLELLYSKVKNKIGILNDSIKELKKRLKVYRVLKKK